MDEYKSFTPCLQEGKVSYRYAILLSMCGRYSFFEPDKMYDRFSIVNRQLNIGIEPHFNITPGDRLPVVVKHSPNQVELMKWGITPPWLRHDPRAKLIINARSETLFEKPMFKRLVTRNRCLVAANGFLEFKKTDSGSIPYYFHLKHESMFAFAGLYDVFKDAEGKEFKSFVIITCKANTLMEPIHHRLPVILPKKHEDDWINPDETNIEKLLQLLQPYPSDEMEMYQVPKEANNARNDYPEVIQPIKS